MIRVLNLYAGIGGNRKLWTDCQVTAVELNPKIARVYRINFPDDNLIIEDAHKYLLNHFNEYDFIWSSYPCQSHSRARFWNLKNDNPIYPDLKLYEEILLLKHYYKGKFLVENVNPYYEPLITPTRAIDRHFFWANFYIANFSIKNICPTNGKISDLEKLYGLNVSNYDFGQRKDQIIRNCVHPEIGNFIFNCARGIIENSNTKQINIFDASH